MSKSQRARVPRRSLLRQAQAVVALALATPGHAQSKRHHQDRRHRRGQAVAGSSIPQAAQLAADEINAAGGVNGNKIEIFSYDDHSTAPEAVRAFQRAVNEDHVNAVIASYISEVVLALEPWTGRLKTVMVTPGAASDVITQNIAKDYDQPQIHVPRLSDVDQPCRSRFAPPRRIFWSNNLHMKSAVVMSEDAAWTTPLDAEYLKCLPKIGLKVRRPYPLLARHHGLHADLQQDRR